LRQVSEIYLKTKISSNSDLDILPVASLKLVPKMNLKFGLAAPQSLLGSKLRLQTSLENPHDRPVKCFRTDLKTSSEISPNSSENF
jgi:hypothetical protein